MIIKRRGLKQAGLYWQDLHNLYICHHLIANCSENFLVSCQQQYTVQTALCSWTGGEKKEGMHSLLHSYILSGNVLIIKFIKPTIWIRALQSHLSSTAISHNTWPGIFSGSQYNITVSDYKGHKYLGPQILL